MTRPAEFVLEPLRERAEFTLYRARQRGNSGPALVVAPSAEQPLPQSLRRLEHEYSLASELDSAWAAKPVALTIHEGRTILVLADPGGEPLDLVLERGGKQPLDLSRLLRLAINLATALGQVHQRGLIHKDIKPGNVLADDAGRIWLAGFGIASRLPRERQTSAPPEILAGTLAYMSPEQTGRMNRSLDARSDLYSLGVTLYEMLTGVLPFTAADPLEWVHCHIARQPVAPADRRAMPEPLSAIVMKLLAKNAEERYQTAAGLEADLRRCLAEWESQGRIDPFTLGLDDFSDRLLIREKLYGREREVDALLAAFDRVVAGGSPEFVLVSGYSGVGKSSVVNELHKALVPSRGLFAAGKFDQYKRDVPYTTLAQAFRMLVRQILVKSEAEVDRWRQALLDSLGPNGQLMVDLIPELEFIIGKQSPIAELPPQEARGRFQLVFRRFLGAFATEEHPLALFLDDLQWLDTATVELLERLMTDPDVRHVLLIGAYRDNEVSSSHPLMRALAAIRDAGAKTQDIMLAPLGLDDVERLIADALRCGPNSAHPLARLVGEKTGGNPFFTIQFLTALAEEGLLRFDRDAAGWIWDMERVRAKRYSVSVVDLMVGKLRRLSPATQAALQRLACLGNVAEIAILRVVFGQSEEEIHDSLLEAVRDGFILRREGSYAFLHDRIQEAAYALIPETERAETHLRMGRALVASMTEEGLAEHLFEVASQLNRGAIFLTDRDEKVRVAAIDLRAGRKAKASAAYASARAYFAAGMELLEETERSHHYELAFALWLECAECKFLAGHLDRAEQLLVELLPRAASKVDEAAVYHLRIRLHVMKSENPQAVDAALTCLRGFGIDIPAHPTQEQVDAELERLWQALNGRPIESLIDLPLMTDPKLKAAMEVLAVLTMAAYSTDLGLHCLHLCRMVNLSMQHGTSDNSAHGYGYWATVLGPLLHCYSEGHRFAKLACDLAEKHGFVASLGKVYAAAGLSATWTQPIATAIDFDRKAFRAAIEVGDLTFACLSMFRFITDILLRNDALDSVWRESETALDFAHQAKYRDVEDIVRSQQRFVATMQGKTVTFSTFSDAQFDEATFEARLTADRMPLMVGLYWILKLKARFLSGDYAEALAAADKAKQLLEASILQIQKLDYFYYTALTVSALYEAALTDKQREWRELLTAHQEQLREWAEVNPPTFADKYTLVSAEIARIEKRDAEALRLYEQAVQEARENGFVQNQGLAHELAAQYCLARGLETAGRAHLHNARNCYDRWGAFGKVKQLDERYPRLRERRTPTASSTMGPPVGQLDIESVVRASQALSSEMVLPRLIEKLVRIAVEYAGAGRGLLILLREGEPRIEAEATAGPSGVGVVARQAAIMPFELAQSVLHYVIRTHEHVLLDDASTEKVYSQDEYVRQKRSKSILCLPIVKQAKLVGALYLENTLTPCAFTPDRVTVLQLLAAQAAISIENAGLYSDLQREGQNFRLIVDSVPGFLCTMTARGEVEFVNRGILDYTGWTLQQMADWRPLLHPDERDKVVTRWTHSVETGDGYEIEHRIVGADGVYRWFAVRGLPACNAAGTIVRWYVLITDIDNQKRAEEALKGREHELKLIIDTIPTLSWCNRTDGSNEFLSKSWHEYTGLSPDEAHGWGWQAAFHPDDLPPLMKKWGEMLVSGEPGEIEARLRRHDGIYRCFLVRAEPFRDESGTILRWYGTSTDIDERKKAEERLQRSEAFLAQGQSISQTGSFGWNVASGEIYWSEETYNIVECARTAKPAFDLVFQRIHPGDQDFVRRTIEQATREKTDFDIEHRFLMPDGRVKHVHIIGRALLNLSGDLDFVGAVTDTTATKQAEEKLRQSESELRQILDSAPQHMYVLGADPGSARLYANRAALDYLGLTFEEWRTLDLHKFIHPDDWERTMSGGQSQVASGLPHEVELRLRRNDGTYRWFLSRRNPLRDQHGRLTHWYTAATDIEDRKAAEQMLRDENISLREEIDKTSMFEEIVGTSAALKKVLSRISKVAPTDSSVLITGETGTGKELVARAVHRRSQRSANAFVSVNCAVIPRDLIASELFGHEKGAFTGATQRRLGRFELAEKGTIFLDEIGELPAETQIALLRVLQEHEFERIGGTGTLRADVRVIAATNRDLDAAIAAGTFRRDLFYRLNVFPVELPPLRKRSEDIPLLVAYFLNRYARKAGRQFTAVDKKSLDRLQAYAWPGNIRELQNVIERSVIINETQTFSVDESWISWQPPASNLEIQSGLLNRPPAEEKAIIEAALRECGGRVYGPSGAASRLGIPRSTLESKIRTLKINKNRFKGPDPSKNH